VTARQHIGLIALGGVRWMGGAAYIRNLAHAIHAADSAVRVSIVSGDVLAPDWKDGDPLIVVPCRAPLLDRLRGRTNRHLARAVEQAGIDFLYPLTYDNEYNLGVSLPIGGALEKEWAGWIPDFQHRYLPELFPENEIKRRNENIAVLAQDAPTMVLSSASAAGDFVRWFPQHAAKSRILRFATSPQPAWDAPLTTELPSVPPRFFLVCNQFWKHKNHLMLFKAAEILRERGVRVSIVCTGELDDFRSPEYAEAVRSFLRTTGLDAQVALVGLVPRRVQIELMRRALAVIQPSLFEGWSTVVEDARVLGRPTLLSDLAVHREQNPPHAHYFPPSDPEALCEIMRDAWTNLSPGPDAASEAAARDDAQRRVIEFGKTFLAVASAHHG
jgi:glycosyltransferase involved in cell wall biosynthesis